MTENFLDEIDSGPEVRFGEKEASNSRRKCCQDRMCSMVRRAAIIGNSEGYYNESASRRAEISNKSQIKVCTRTAGKSHWRAEITGLAHILTV